VVPARIALLPNGRGAAMSGMSYELLKVLYSDDLSRQYLRKLVIDAVNGVAPPSILAWMRTSMVLALDKGVGTPEAPSVRPIALIEVLRRWVAKALHIEFIHLVGPTLFFPFQFAVEVKDGTEIVAHQISSFISSYPDLFVASMDLKNAFHSFLRASLWCAVREYAPFLLPYVHTFCSTPSPIMAHPDTISMERGVLQGDPMSMLLTCLVIKYALDKSLLKLQSMGTPSQPALSLLYADNLYILGSRKLILAGIRDIPIAAVPHGLNFPLINIYSPRAHFPSVRNTSLVNLCL